MAKQQPDLVRYPVEHRKELSASAKASALRLMPHRGKLAPVLPERDQAAEVDFTEQAGIPLDRRQQRPSSSSSMR